MSTLPSGEFVIMGVVNVTPDSFSDGGRYLETRAAVSHALELAAEGAQILDIGGESTRPGAEPVSATEQKRRVLPVIQALRDRDTGVHISVDTASAEVAEAALEAGATIVNDITALRGDPGMADVVAGTGAQVCLMHMLGTPRTMQQDPRYDDVVTEVRAFLEERVGAARTAGIPEQRIMLDPGIGFGKTTEHNLELLARLDVLADIGPPVMVGASRKSFLGRITGRAVDERVSATVAANVLAFDRGARIFRVHDVAPTRDALLIAAATVGRPWSATTPTSSTTT